MLTALLAAAVTVASATTVEITYLGNEGFLLVAGDRKVLVDALVATDMPSYVDQAPELRQQLLEAEPPFDGVDLVLATHEHGDHFDAQAVGRHLVANPEATFVSTPGAVRRLEREFAGFVTIGNRVHAVSPPADRPRSMDGLGLTVLNLHHGKDRSYRTPDNNGYLIELAGMRLLHIGDTEVTADELRPLDLPGREIDLAFIPSWYFDARPWKGAVEAAIRPRETVVMHLAPRFATESRTSNQRQSRERVPRIRKAYPDAIVFERPLETRRLAPQPSTPGS